MMFSSASRSERSSSRLERSAARQARSLSARAASKLFLRQSQARPLETVVQAQEGIAGHDPIAFAKRHLDDHSPILRRQLRPAVRPDGTRPGVGDGLLYQTPTHRLDLDLDRLGLEDRHLQSDANRDEKSHDEKPFEPFVHGFTPMRVGPISNCSRGGRWSSQVILLPLGQADTIAEDRVFCPGSTIHHQIRRDRNEEDFGHRSSGSDRLGAGSRIASQVWLRQRGRL